MNRFAYYSRDEKQTVQYVQSILPFLSDIREVALYHPKKSPYVEVIQEPSRRSIFYNRHEYKAVAKGTSLGRSIRHLQIYTCVLRDDFYNEVWLYVSPRKIETTEIFHMLGLKELINFQNKKTFQAKELTPCHDLNVLVELKEKQAFLASFTFPYACKRFSATEVMHSYGYLQPFLTKDDYGEYLEYFKDKPIRNNETYDYATNQTFMFEDETITESEAMEIFEDIALKESGTVTFRLTESPE